ncbi:MAG: hypothetical protein RR425_01150 [Erysipelotrichales bacterium]
MICIIYNISTFIKLKKTKEYNFSEYLEHKSGGLSFMILQIIISGLFIATTHVLVSNPIT